MSEDRKLMGPLEWSLLLAAVAILCYILLQNEGMPVIEQTRDTKILDREEMQEKQKERPMVTRPSPKQSPSTEDVDAVLQDLAREFAGGEDVRAKQKLSADEEKYIREVKAKKSKENPIRTATEWFRLIQKSHQTYTQVREFFEAEPVPIKQQGMWSDEERQEDWVKKISSELDIPEEDARTLAEKGTTALSEWAKLVDPQRD